MSKQVNILSIPLGQEGLQTDDPQSKLGIGTLIRALNLNMQNGLIEKDFGSRRWNSSALPSGIRGAYDWNPNEATQRMVVVTAAGRVYKFIDPTSYTEITASSGAPTTLNVSTQEFVNIVSGGNESYGRDKKLFIFTGRDQIQVVAADASTRANISNPVSDWSGNNYPIDGLIHRGRLFTWVRSGHTVQASLATNHENFTSSPLNFDVFPGEGERITQGFVFKGQLYIAKYPRGLYVLVDTDTSSSNWYFQKLNSSFGAPSTRSAVGVFDDVVFGNEYGSISSIGTVSVSGDIKTGDYFAQMRVQKFVRDEISRYPYSRQAVYYPDKKIAMFTFRSKTGSQNDRICFLDFQQPNAPKVMWISKDQPSTLFLYKDIDSVERPFYGAEDGYIYQMDVADRWVGVSSGSPQTAYTGEFWIPSQDISGGDAPTSEVDKNFEEIGIEYEATGAHSLSVDCYVDGRFVKTLNFELSSGSELDTFTLDEDTLDSEEPLTRTLPLGANGRRIAFRCYNSGVGENFRILSLRIYFKLAGHTNKR